MVRQRRRADRLQRDRRAGLGTHRGSPATVAEGAFFPVRVSGPQRMACRVVSAIDRSEPVIRARRTAGDTPADRSRERGRRFAEGRVSGRDVVK